MYTRPFCQHFIAGATGCYRYYFALRINYFSNVLNYRIINNLHFLFLCPLCTESPSFMAFQNPDIVLVHYLNVPYPDDNKMAVITPSLALWGDKKEWTKEELVCQLKPMCKLKKKLLFRFCEKPIFAYIHSMNFMHRKIFESNFFFLHFGSNQRFLPNSFQRRWTGCNERNWNHCKFLNYSLICDSIEYFHWFHILKKKKLVKTQSKDIEI